MGKKLRDKFIMGALNLVFMVFIPLTSVFAEVATPYSVPRNIILIGWDGADRAIVKELIRQGKLPNLKKLSKEGNLVDINITNKTDTKAGWAEILTGYDYRITGVYGNRKFSSIPKGYTIFERIKEFYEVAHYATVAVIGKPRNLDAKAEGDPYFYAREDLDVWDSDKMRGNYIVKEKALRYLSDFRDVGSFFFFHFGLADCEGHRFGPDSAEYVNALVSCDNALGEIIARLKQLGIYDVTVIYVVSDHGFDKELRQFPIPGSHWNADKVFLATNDKNIIRKEGNRLDIAPTILKKAGLDVAKIDPPLNGSALID